MFLESAGPRRTRVAPGGLERRGRADADPRRDRPATCSACTSTSPRARGSRGGSRAPSGAARRRRAALRRERATRRRALRPRARRSPARRATCSSRAKRFGREDLAFVSYHMGIGNLQSVLRAYGGGDAALRRSSTSTRRRPTTPPPIGGSPASATTRPTTCGSSPRRRRSCACTATTGRSSTGSSALQRAKASAEEVLHPRRPHAGVRTPADAQARAGTSARRAVPGATRPSPACGATRAWASSRGACTSPAGLYRGLRPEALAMALYIGAQVRAISHTSAADRHLDRARRRLPVAADRAPTARRRATSRCTRPAGRSTSRAVPVAAPGAGVPVRARPAARR